MSEDNVIKIKGKASKQAELPTPNLDFMLKDKAILVDRKVVPPKTWEEWGNFFENKDNRIVAQDKVRDVFISTVFLGMDHRFGEHEHKIKHGLWFETMIFQGPHTHTKHHEFQDRYETWEEAEAGHKRAKNLVLTELGFPNE